MRLVIDTGEVLEIKVGINLRRAQIGMSQQFLYRAQVVAGFEQVRCKRVAQHVRVQRYANTLLLCTLFQSVLNAAVTDTFAAAAGEQGFFMQFGQFGAMLQPLL